MRMDRIDVGPLAALAQGHKTDASASHPLRMPRSNTIPFCDSVAVPSAAGATFDWARPIPPMTKTATTAKRRSAARGTATPAGKASQGRARAPNTATRKRPKPSKPQASKERLVRLAEAGPARPRRRRKPLIVRETRGCVGLVLGQAPPGPRGSLPKGWRPLAGPAEQRLAKLAGVPSPAELWAEFDRGNLLSWYPGLKARAAKHDVKKGYRLHQSDGDVFPMDEARLAAAKVDLRPYACVLLLGNNVARAFGLKAGLLRTEVRSGCRLMTFPHPSGVSHYWNDPGNVQRAAEALRVVLGEMRERLHGA